MTVSTVTAPPVPACLVMTLDPSAATSATGKPSGRSRRGRSRKPLKLPPVACVPHSITWPATTAPASSSYDVARPAVVRDRRADDERGVGDAAGDDDVGAGGQGGGDAEAAEVGVGGEGVVPVRPRWRTSSPSTCATCGSRPRPGGDLAEPVGEAGGVEPAGVGDDLHAALEGEAEAVLDLADEGAGVAEGRVLELVLAEDEHGELGEVVAGEDVEALPSSAHPRASRASR